MTGRALEISLRGVQKRNYGPIFLRKSMFFFPVCRLHFITDDSSQLCAICIHIGPSILNVVPCVLSIGVVPYLEPKHACYKHTPLTLLQTDDLDLSVM